MIHSSSPHVVVIGAGMAGLAAARYLDRAGLAVTVLEKTGHVGGRASTTTRDGFRIDTGAGFFANFYTNTRNMVRELGLNSDIVGIPDHGAVLVDGQLCRLGLRTLPLSIRSKIALGKLMTFILLHWQQLDVHAIHKAHLLDIRSVAEYSARHFDHEVLDRFIAPLLSGMLYYRLDRTSQIVLFLLVKASIGMRRFTLRQGVGRLAEAMSSGLQVSTNMDVYKVIANRADGYTVFARTDGDERRHAADGVVCAVPATNVLELFQDLSVRQQRFFSSVSYSSTAVVAVGLARSSPLICESMFIAPGDSGVRHLVAATSLSAKNPAQVPNGCEVVRLFSSGHAGQDLLTLDDAAVRHILVEDLNKTGFGYDPKSEEIFCQVYRWHHALPEFDTGYFKLLRRFADGEIESGRLVFAGDYLGGPFVEGAITSGMDAARRLLRRLEPVMD